MKICNSSLMQKLQLEGYEQGEEQSDSMICPTIKAENNCCSQIDEIKIIKNWTEFSSIKLENFVNQMIYKYERIFKLSDYVKTMKSDSIDFHYSKYVWKKVKNQTCVNKKFFIKQSDLEELILLERQETDWLGNWISGIQKQIITNLLQVIIEMGVMSVADFQEYVEKKIKEDENIYDELKNIQKDVILDDRVDKIAAKIEQILQNVPKESINFTKKPKNQTEADYIKKQIKSKEIVMKHVQNSIDQKLLKEVKENSQKNMIGKLNRFVDQNQTKITHITGYVLDNETKKQIIEDLKKTFEKDQELNYMFKFMYDPKIIQGDSVNSQILSEINDNLLKAFQNSMEGKQYDKNFNQEHLFAILYDNFLSNVNFTQLIQDDLHKPILQPLVNLIFSGMINDTIQLKSKKKSDLEIEELKKAYFSVYQDFEKKNHRIIEVSLPNKKFQNFVDLQQSVCDYVYNYWMQYTDKIPTQFREIFNMEQIQKKFKNTVIELQNSIKNDIFLSQNNQEKVCAEVTNHQMVRQLVFNKKKNQFCAFAQKTLLDFDLENLKKQFTNFKELLLKIIQLKSKSYCIVCDKQSQFDPTGTMLNISDDFCLKLFQENKPYLELKNQLTTFLHNLIQYVKCFMTSGRKKELPFQYKYYQDFKNIKIIDHCLTIKSADQIASCRNYCKNYKLFEFSNEWEGTLNYLNYIYTFVLATVRKTGFLYKKEVDQEDEKIVEIFSNISPKELKQLRDQEVSLQSDLIQGIDTNFFNRSALSFLSNQGRLLEGKFKKKVPHNQYIDRIQNHHQKFRRLLRQQKYIKHQQKTLKKINRQHDKRKLILKEILGWFKNKPKKLLDNWSSQETISKLQSSDTTQIKNHIKNSPYGRWFASQMNLIKRFIR